MDLARNFFLGSCKQYAENAQCFFSVISKMEITEWCHCRREGSLKYDLKGIPPPPTECRRVGMTPLRSDRATRSKHKTVHVQKMHMHLHVQFLNIWYNQSEIN